MAVEKLSGGAAWRGGDAVSLKLPLISVVGGVDPGCGP